MKDLNERSRGLKYMWRYSHKDGGEYAEMLGEVKGITLDLVHWRHIVDLQQRTCTCSRWQFLVYHAHMPCVLSRCQDGCWN
ncbi:hypothetical protein BS78_05G150000 [Paspalum vaginatum]|nr:hypothetical protein BS78_05G150000 [Paspalum vaginatum]